MTRSGPLKLLAIVLAVTVGFPTPVWALKRSEATSIIPEGEYLVKSGRRVSHSRTVAAYKAKKKPQVYRATEARSRKPAKAPKTVKTAKTAKAAKSAKAVRTVKSAKPAKKPVPRLARKTAKAPAKKVAKSKSARPSRGIASRAPKKKPAKSQTKRFRAETKRGGTRHAAKPARFGKSRKADRRTATHARPRARPVVRRERHERDLPLVSAPRRKTAREDRFIVMEDPAVKAPLPKPNRVGAMITPDQTVLDPASDGAPAEVIDAKAAAAEAEPIVGPAPASVAEVPGADPVPGAEPEAAQLAAESASREPDAFDLHSGADPMRGP